MTTLIIHPKDPSTRFLEVIYKNIPDKTVITGRTQKNKIASLIESHDRGNDNGSRMSLRFILRWTI